MVQSSTQYLVRNDLITVGTASVNIAEGVPRQAIVIRNSSTAAQEITLNLGFNVAVANKGIVLKAGESFTDSTSEGYVCYQGQITAIASAANGQVSVMER